VLIGTSIFGFGGWVWGSTVIAFFVSSSLLSHYGESRKALLREKFAKDSRRDLAQTLANGGLAAAIAVVTGLVGRTSPIFPLLALAFYGALAAANADTWATELGVLAKQPPRLITTGKVVPTGTSGGVTWQGMAAAVGGAAFIGLSAFLLTQGAAWVTLGSWLPQDWVLIPVAAVSGLAGSVGGDGSGHVLLRQLQQRDRAGDPPLRAAGALAVRLALVGQRLGQFPGDGGGRGNRRNGGHAPVLGSHSLPKTCVMRDA
jgi:hypothetical protein